MHPDILRLHQLVENEHWWFVSRRRIVGALLDELLAQDPSAVVIDLGCGTGGNIAALGSQYECWGVDLDADAVAYAAEAHPDCNFVRGSVLDRSTWPYLQRVDCCLLMDVMEHLEDDRAAVANATAALTQGGHLLVTVPADPQLWSQHDVVHGHFRRYTVASLQRVLEGLPLECRLLTALNSRLYHPIRLWRRMSRRLSWLVGRRTTGDAKLPPAFGNRLLTRIFSGELRHVLDALDAPPDERRGVSLLAVYRRT